MQGGVCGRHDRWSAGGIVTHDPGRLYEEIAYIAYHFHWSLDEILDLEHPVRQRFIEEITRLHGADSSRPKP